MKISPMLTVAAVFAAVTASAPAAAADPVYTMTGAVVTSKISVSGCAALTTGGLANATFYDDGTYEIVRDAVGLTAPLIGSWSVVPSKTSYTVYMTPNNDAESPLEEPSEPGSIDEMFAAFDILALANCQLKYPAATVSIIQPSVAISKNAMVVKNADKSATLTFAMKGKQQNTFKGATKVGAFSSTIIMKGIVVEATTTL
jgi:hypothetical protein